MCRLKQPKPCAVPSLANFKEPIMISIVALATSKVVE